jgi:hypothetical protein
VGLPTGTLNHAEMVFGPGEEALCRRALDAIGCEVGKDLALDHWLVVDGGAFLISEVTTEQWSFEQWLGPLVKEQGGTQYEEYLNRLGVGPQRYTHLGIGLTSLEIWEQRVARIQDLPNTDPELGERMKVASVFRPGDPGSYGLFQAFIRTDVFAAGLLTLGQTVELQYSPH